MEISEQLAKERAKVEPAIPGEANDWTEESYGFSTFARIRFPTAVIIDRGNDNNVVGFQVRINGKDVTFRSSDWNTAMGGSSGVRSVRARELKDGGVMLLLMNREIPTTTDGRRRRADGFRTALLKQVGVAVKATESEQLTASSGTGAKQRFPSTGRGRGSWSPRD